MDKTDELSAEKPTIDQFVALARGRRSHRGFDKHRDVSDAHIRQMIEVARWAPSAANGQPWHFIVIRNDADREFNAKVFLRQYELKRETEMAARGQVKMPAANFRDAPVHILAVGDTRVNEAYPIMSVIERAERNFENGMNNATLSLMLAATCLGLVTQYVTAASSAYMAVMLKLHYGIPDRFEVSELIPVGWPIAEVKPSLRRPLESLIHYDRFDPANHIPDESFREQFLMRYTRLAGWGKSDAGKGAG